MWQIKADLVSPLPPIQSIRAGDTAVLVPMSLMFYEICAQRLCSESHVSDPDFDLPWPCISSFAESPASADHCQLQALLSIKKPEAKDTFSLLPMTSKLKTAAPQILVFSQFAEL